MIEVLNPGIYSSIQDGGRHGYRHLGIPEAGFMDSNSAMMANAILNKPENSAIIEMAFRGSHFRFNNDTQVTIGGAEVKAVIGKSTVQLGVPTLIKAGQELKILDVNKGVWSYMAIAGEIVSDFVLNSYSQFNHITPFFRLKKGQIIDIIDSYRVDSKNSKLRMERTQLLKEEVDVYPGPEFELLPKDFISGIELIEFNILSSSNRMAYGFENKIMTHRHSILTSAVLPGTIQWTPSGQLFCLMRDAQTTGGYPRVFQLDEKSINVLSQKQPGDFVKFNLIM